MSSSLLLSRKQAAFQKNALLWACPDLEDHNIYPVALNKTPDQEMPSFLMTPPKSRGQQATKMLCSDSRRT